MNIAIIIQTLGGGGAERVAKIIGDYYSERGNRVYYFLGDTRVKQAYQVKGEVINTGIKSCTSNIIYGNMQILTKLLYNSMQMRKYKKKYDIDVAISFMEESNYMNILSKGKEKVITRICTILSQDGGWVTFLYHKRMIHFFYPKADRVVIMSDYAREDMHDKFGIPMKKMIKIPNPVLIPEENETDDFNWNYGDNAIVVIGRLADEKQHDKIIRAFTYVHDRNPQARLIILGAGPKENYLKNVRKRYNLNDVVVFAGFQSNVSFYLKNSKVFAMASTVEGYPNSMLEAMANGLPIVTTDIPGGCGEIVGKNDSKKLCNEIQYCRYGILTPYMCGPVQLDKELTREERLFGKAMLEVLEDRRLREKYCRRSLKRASSFQIDKIMPKWDRLICK